MLPDTAFRTVSRSGVGGVASVEVGCWVDRGTIKISAGEVRAVQQQETLAASEPPGSLARLLVLDAPVSNEATGISRSDVV